MLLIKQSEGEKSNAEEGILALAWRCVLWYAHIVCWEQNIIANSTSLLILELDFFVVKIVCSGELGGFVSVEQD